MQDTIDVVKAVQNVFDNDTAFTVLKDFERVLDELDLYVYDNWQDGELAAGPIIKRHFVSCTFMWPRKQMPDPMGGKRLTDYQCKVYFKKDELIVPRQILEPGDMRAGTKKGKLDKAPIWLVEILMPKELIRSIHSGYEQEEIYAQEPATSEEIPAEQQVEPADATEPVPAPEPTAEPGGEF